MPASDRLSKGGDEEISKSVEKTPLAVLGAAGSRSAARSGFRCKSVPLHRTAQPPGGQVTLSGASDESPLLLLNWRLLGQGFGIWVLEKLPPGL